jgi:hypothetical protein
MNQIAISIGAAMMSLVCLQTAQASGCPVNIAHLRFAEFLADSLARDAQQFAEQSERNVRDDLGHYPVIAEAVILELQDTGRALVRLRHNYRGPVAAPSSVDVRLKLAQGFTVGQEVLIYREALEPPAPAPAPASAGADSELDDLIHNGPRIPRDDECPALVYPLDSAFAQNQIRWLRQFQNDPLAPVTLLLRPHFDGRPQPNGILRVLLESLDGQNKDQNIEVSLASLNVDATGQVLNPGLYRVHWPRIYGYRAPRCNSEPGQACDVQLIAHSIVRLSVVYNAGL